MQLAGDVNFEELARSTDEFNAAQLKAVCVEAGMIALREGASKLNHEHFHSGIAEGNVIVLFTRSIRNLTRILLQCKARRRTISCTSHSFHVHLVWEFNSIFKSPEVPHFQMFSTGSVSLLPLEFSSPDVPSRLTSSPRA